MLSDFMFGDYQISPIGNVHGCTLAKSSCLFWVHNIKKRKNAAANRAPPNHYNSLLEGNGNPLQYSCLENPMDGRRSLVGCSPWGREESDTTERLHIHFSLFTFMHWRRKWQPAPVFLPEESQGRGSLVGCHLWGRTESDTTEVT